MLTLVYSWAGQILTAKTLAPQANSCTPRLSTKLEALRNPRRSREEFEKGVHLRFIRVEKNTKKVILNFRLK